MARGYVLVEMFCVGYMDVGKAEARYLPPYLPQKKTL